MVILMARPMRRKGSDIAYFRKRVPTELRPKLQGSIFAVDLPANMSGDGQTIQISSKITAEIKFSLQTSEPKLIALRNATALAHATAFFEAALRGPRDLTALEVEALLGVAYRQIIGEHREKLPTTSSRGEGDRAEEWSELEEWRALIGDTSRFVATGSDAGRKAAIDRVKPILDVEAFFAAQATNLTTASYNAFLNSLPNTLHRAYQSVSKLASGDYSADAIGDQYPMWMARRTGAARGNVDGQVKTFSDLFERWRNEAPRSASTISTWQGYVNRFEQFIEHDDPHRVTRKDALRWKDALIAEGRKKISTTYLAALNTLYRFGISNVETSGIRENPFDGVKAAQKAVAGTGRLPFTNADVGMILKAARAEKLPYLRWVPWLQAMTGSRVAEMTQLWGSMIIVQDGLPCISIQPAPDGGSIKNIESERVIPIHPDLIAEGFMSFVEEQGKGPLFYRRSERRAAKARTDGANKHRSKGIANRVGEWVREIGITELRKAPTHAFRRWFKIELTRAGVQDRLTDAIQGQAPRSEADKYFHADPSMMLAAMSKLDLRGLADRGANATTAASSAANKNSPLE